MSMPDDRNIDLTRIDLTRRSLLGAAAAGAGGVMLAGCGGSSKSGGTSSPAPTKRGGTFRLGTSDGSASDSLDSILSDASYTNLVRSRALYDLLVAVDENTNQPKPFLAEEFEPAPDLSYYTVRVRQAEFHNGKPVTADDVIFSLRRVLNPKAAASDAGLIASVDPQRMQKLDS